MNADALLSRLDRVKRTGAGRWIARCPAHADRSPSLSIRELDDGRILLHDFGGCGAAAVVAAVGMGLSDLMPERIDTREADHDGKRRYNSRERRPFIPADALEVARLEILTAAIVAADFLSGREVSDTDRTRLLVAGERLTEIAEVAYGRS